MQIALMKSLNDHIRLYSEDSTMGRLLRDCKRMITNQAEDIHEKGELIKGLQCSETIRIEQLKLVRAELDSLKESKRKRARSKTNKVEGSKF